MGFEPTCITHPPYRRRTRSNGAASSIDAKLLHKRIHRAAKPRRVWIVGVKPSGYSYVILFVPRFAGRTSSPPLTRGNNNDRYDAYGCS